MASSQPVKNNNFLKYQSFGNAIMIYLSKAIAMSWLLMWTLSPHLGACTILHWSLLHLPAKLRGGDACQKGLSSPPLSKQETHTREQAACKAGGEELLACTTLHWSLSCTCQASSEGEMLARKRDSQM